MKSFDEIGEGCEECMFDRRLWDGRGVGYILPLRTLERVSGRISMISLWFGCLLWLEGEGEGGRDVMYPYMLGRSNVVGEVGVGVGVGKLIKQRRALMIGGGRCA